VVLVTNEGEYDLTLKTAEMAEDAKAQLQTDAKTNADRSLREGGSFEVLVVCRWAGPGDAVGALTITTDDPGTPRVEVPVTCAAPQADTDTDG
jgi:hypothetical protein